MRESQTPWLQVVLTWMKSFNPKRRRPGYWNDNAGQQERQLQRRSVNIFGNTQIWVSACFPRIEVVQDSEQSQEEVTHNQLLHFTQLSSEPYLVGITAYHLHV